MTHFERMEYTVIVQRNITMLRPPSPEGIIANHLVSPERYAHVHISKYIDQIRSVIKKINRIKRLLEDLAIEDSLQLLYFEPSIAANDPWDFTPDFIDFEVAKKSDLIVSVDTHDTQLAAVLMLMQQNKKMLGAVNVDEAKADILDTEPRIYPIDTRFKEFTRRSLRDALHAS